VLKSFGQSLVKTYFDVGVAFMEFKSPPACSTFGDLLVLQIHSSFIALPLASGGSSSDAVWLVSLSQARSQTGMVPECESMLNHHLGY